MLWCGDKKIKVKCGKCHVSSMWKELELAGER